MSDLALDEQEFRGELRSCTEEELRAFLSCLRQLRQGSVYIWMDAYPAFPYV